MCGRYYVNDEMANEIENMIRQIDRTGRAKSSVPTDRRITAGDIFPGKDAPILVENERHIGCEWQHWGVPLPQGPSLPQSRRLIFNARCESVLEKPLFRDSVRHRRIVVPAAGFYEWNCRKEKNTFRRKDDSVLFMAGLCRRYQDGEHFVILTTCANASMQPVHDRMPLILERDEIPAWISDLASASRLLHKIPCLLERETDYEQLSLFASRADEQ